MSARIIVGDALESLRTLDAESVQCCVTSPPYWGLRDYGVAGQLGLEKSPAEYVAAMVEVFREVRRVLRKDGTLWLNLGDSYAVNGGARKYGASDGAVGRGDAPGSPRRAPESFKPKDLIGIPWRVAFALQDDGWWLRSDIVWEKPNPMPESVTDRPTKAHEYLFLMSKSSRYHYDATAIAEPCASSPEGFVYEGGYKDMLEHREAEKSVNVGSSRLANGTVPHFAAGYGDKRNARSVWTIATTPFKDAHFATFPPELPRRCILAGSRVGDTVLDPFAGAGTTMLVADRLQRNGVGIELNPKYAAMAERRIRDDAPLFASNE